MTIALILHCDGATQPGDEPYHCTETFGTDAWYRPAGSDNLMAAARRAGWKVGPKGDAMCPACGKPDPRTLRLIETFVVKARVIGGDAA